ncbi:SH2 domain-containing protein 7 [Toxotes jaculatrix]|uniref:SH2 domain-containing protein 7 n=1 Tax=Toxotes jaculatrix TaxID=941984 RepID=UPI001B3B0AA7|nr:SH2 domain-containing protein 7 [Toxotes jaculatrix]
MEKKLGVDLQTETSEGGLKELVLRWFTETQAAIILNNGNFPNWFQGFAARKDAEDLLRDKALGCFLIRLSDKAIGYILSYKGHDRCRHFVITQNQDGQFVISGDCQTYDSLTELIEHFRVSPIQPFGEYLTSSCHEENAGELYDVVNCKSNGKSGVSVQALRTLWDQKKDHHSDPGNNQRLRQENDPPAVQPPALPPKSKSRKLTGTVSVDAMSLSQGVPPVPKRGIPLGFSLSGSLPESSSYSSETQTDSNRSERLQGNTAPVLKTDRDSFNSTDTSYPENLCPAGTTYSELTQVESRSKSLPQLDNNNMEEEEYSNRLSSPSFTTSYSPTPLKRVTCHTYSLHGPGAQRPSISRSEQQSDDLEMLRSNPLYQTSEVPGGSSAQQGDGMYAEVPQRPTPAGLPDDTYEQIPGEANAVQGNTYESLDDMKTKKSKSTWGKNNMKWKKFLPDYKKK